MKLRVEGLKPGSVYRLQARSIDSESNKSEWSESYEYTAPIDTTPPPVPASLAINFTESTFVATWDDTRYSKDYLPVEDVIRDFKDFKITISWDAAFDPAKSRTYYSRSPRFEFPLEVNRKEFTTPRATLYISVQARDTSNNESAAATLSATNPAPSTPTGTFTATGLSQAYSVNVAGLTGKPNDYQSTIINMYDASSGGAATQILEGTDSALIYQTTNYSTKYLTAQYKDVFGLIGTETSPRVSVTALNPVIVDTTPPSTPTGIAASWVGTVFRVTFNQVADAARYELTITRSGGADSRSFGLTATGDAVQTFNLTVSDNSAAWGSAQKTLRASVKAIDTYGNTSAASSFTADTTYAVSVPAVGTPAAVAANYSYLASWDADTSDAKSYTEVAHAASSGGTLTTVWQGSGISAIVSATSIKYVKIRHVNVFGDFGAYSAEIPVTPLDPVLSALDTTAPLPATSPVATYTTPTYSLAFDKPVASDLKDFIIELTGATTVRLTLEAIAATSQTFKLSIEENKALWGTAQVTISGNIYSRDKLGNISAGVAIGSATSTDNTAVPTGGSVNAISNGYTVSWTKPAWSGYSYTEVRDSSTLGGTYTAVWNGTDTTATISRGTDYTARYVKIRHYDVFGRYKEDAAGTAVTPTDPNPAVICAAPLVGTSSWVNTTYRYVFPKSTTNDAASYIVILTANSITRNYSVPATGSATETIDIVFAENAVAFGGAQKTIVASVKAVSPTGNITAASPTSTATYATATPAVTGAATVNGNYSYTTSWTKLITEDYSYTEVSHADSSGGALTVVWQGTGNSAVITATTVKYVKVRHRNIFNDWGAYSSEMTATPTDPVTAAIDTDPPEVVTSVTRTFTGTDYVINFTKPVDTDLRDFVIILDPAGTPKTVTQLADPSNNAQVYTLGFDENKALWGTAKSAIAATIKTRDNVGNLNAGTAVTSITATDNTAVPTGGSVNAITKGYTVSWTKPAWAGYSYTEVHDSSSLGGTYTAVWTGTDTTASISRGTDYTARYVKIRHYDVFGRYKEDAAGTAVTPIDPAKLLDSTAPANVTNVARTFTGTDLVVTWDKPADTDLSSFVITLNNGTTDKYFTQLADTANTSQTFTLKLADNIAVWGASAVTISGSIKAKDFAGNVNTGTAITSITATNNLTVPANVDIQAQVSSYSVSWTKPTFAGYSYSTVEDSSTINGTFTSVWSGTDSSAVINRGDYSIRWVKVKHYDVFGRVSTASAAVSVTPINPVSADTTAPTAVTAGFSSTSAVDTKDTSGQAVIVTANWTGVADSDVAGYKVKFSQTNNSASAGTVVDVPNAQGSGTGSKSAIFYGVTGQTYYWWVASYDYLNNISAWSATQTAVATTDTTAPATPTGLALTVKDNNINATWTGSATGADFNPALGIGRYKVELATDSGYTANYQYQSAASTAISFAVPLWSTTYYVKVSAVDTSGNISAATANVTAATGIDPARNPQGMALNEDPALADANAWSLLWADAGTFTTITDGKTGPTVLRSATSAASIYVAKNYIPLDPTKYYRVTMWARRTTAAVNIMYLGLSLISNGVECEGDGTFWSYDLGNGIGASQTWTQYSATFTPLMYPSVSTTATYASGGAAGSTGVVISAPNTDIRPGQVLTGTGFAANTQVRNVSGTTIGFQPPASSQISGTLTFTKRDSIKMSPVMYLNYTGLTGAIEINDVRIEEVMGPTLIQDDAITTPKIVAGAITASKFAADNALINQTLRIGDTAANQINLVAGSTTLAGKVYSGSSGVYNNVNTGFYLDGGGNFSLKDKLSFDGATTSTLTVNGVIQATSGYFAGALSVGNGGTMKIGVDVNSTNDGIYIDANNYWYNTGNISIGSATDNVTWNGTTLAVTGNITAKGGSFTGNIQANGGSFYAGALPGSGQRLIMNSSGITGYNSGGVAQFTLTTDGALNATSATISGAITATSGSIASGVTIGGTAASTVASGAAAGAVAPIIYRQDAAPATTGPEKSIWYDTNDNNKTYVLLSSVWTATETNATGVGLGNVSNLTPQNQAQTGLISGTTITGGGITLSGGGNIKGGQTDYNTGTGFFLGYSGGYKFSIGNPAADNLTWNGSNLSISGNLTLTGITIDRSGKIYTTGKTYGTSTAGYILDYNAGTPVMELSNAARSAYLQWTGADLIIRGNITADAGVIGGATGWTIGASKISSGSGGTEVGLATNGASAFWAGGSSTLAPFRVTHDGILTATSGTIGGITLGATKLYTGTGTFGATNTGFYIDSSGNFSLEDQLKWDGATLNINGAVAMLNGDVRGNLGIGGSLIASTRATVTNKALTTNVVTLTTSGAHGFVATDTVVVSLNDPVFDGTFTLASGSGTTMTYAKTNDNVVSVAATGYVTRSNKSAVVLNSTGVAAIDSAGVTQVSLVNDGTIIAKRGTIGGWTLADTTLTGTAVTIDSAGNLSLGSANNIVRLSSSDATYALWAGNAAGASAPFSVTKAGLVSMTSGSIGNSVTIGGTAATTVASGAAAGAVAPIVYRQGTTPVTTGPAGSIWIDTANANKIYVLVASVWTASGETTAYRQATAPSVTVPVGSVWFDTDDGKTYTLVAGTPNVWTEAGLNNVSNLTPQNQAQTGLIAGTTITGGGITLSAGGIIKGGKTGYADSTNAGFFIGYDGTGTAGYKIYAGSASDANYIKWDASTLTIKGDLVSATGTFTGALSGGTISIGSGESIFKADSNGIYLGSATFATAEFSVTPAGLLKAESGTIGGINLGSTKIYTGTGTFNNPNTGFYADSAGQFSLKDQLSWNGTALTVQGNINAMSGYFNGNIWLKSRNIIGGNSAQDIADHASFETAVGTNSCYQASALRVANNAYVDSACLQITSNVTGNWQYFSGANYLDWSSVTANTNYYVTAQAKLGTETNNTMIVGIRFYDANSNHLGDRMGNWFTVNASTYTKLTAYVTAPASSAYGSAIVQMNGANNTKTVYVDAVGIFEDSDTWSMPTTGSLIAGNSATGGARVIFNSTGISGYNANESESTFSVLSSTGALKARSGTVGGWTLGDTTLTGTAMQLTNTGKLFAGNANNSITIDAAVGEPYAIWAGHTTAASAVFKVSKAGILTAAGATINGAITANSGTFNGVVQAQGGSFSGNVYLTGHNRMTANQSTIETDTSGWTFATGSIARDNAQAKSGTYSLRFTGGGYASTDILRTAVTAGKQYTGSVWIRPGTYTGVVTFRMYWSTGAYVDNGYVDGSLTPAEGTWTQLVATGVAPANTQSAYLYITGPTTGLTIYIDQAGIWAGDSTTWEAGGTSASLIAGGTQSLVNGSITGQRVELTNTGLQGFDSGGLTVFQLPTGAGTIASIGGWSFDATKIYSGSGLAFTGIQSAASGIAFFAGASTNVGASAKFSVTDAGALTSTSGTIGGWNIDTTKLYSTASGTNNVTGLIKSTTSGDITIFAGANDNVGGGAKFSVTAGGLLTATAGSIGNSVTIGGTAASTVASGAAAGAVAPIVYRQPAAPAPTGPSGSIWYDTDDSNKTYILVGGAWQITEIDKTGIGLGSVENKNAKDQAESGLTTGTTITGGGITLSGGGKIMGGQTDYNTGTGFFLGYSGGYKFSIGNSAGDSLTWNGTTLNIKGTITADYGTIGGATGWNIGAGKIYSGSGSSFTGVMGGTGTAFFAGATDNAGANAKFSVTAAGSLSATNATISGIVGATELYADTGKISDSIFIASKNILSENQSYGKVIGEFLPWAASTIAAVSHASDSNYGVNDGGGWASIEVTKSTIQNTGLSTNINADFGWADPIGHSVIPVGTPITGVAYVYVPSGNENILARMYIRLLTSADGHLSYESPANQGDGFKTVQTSDGWVKLYYTFINAQATAAKFQLIIGDNNSAPTAGHKFRVDAMSVHLGYSQTWKPGGYRSGLFIGGTYGGSTFSGIRSGNDTNVVFFAGGNAQLGTGTNLFQVTNAGAVTAYNMTLNGGALTTAATGSRVSISTTNTDTSGMTFIQGRTNGNHYKADGVFRIYNPDNYYTYLILDGPQRGYHRQGATDFNRRAFAGMSFTSYDEHQASEGDNSTGYGTATIEGDRVEIYAGNEQYPRVSLTVDSQWTWQAILDYGSTLTGTVTSANSISLTKTGAGWTASNLIGCYVIISAGTGATLNPVLITANTTTAISVAAWANGTPDATSTFKIVSNPAENASNIILLQNSWVSYDPSEATFSVPRFRKMPDGTVRLKGLIKSGTTTLPTTLFTLPGGYRPTKRCIFIAKCSPDDTGQAKLDVASNGDVILASFTGTPGAHLSLDGINFDTV